MGMSRHSWAAAALHSYTPTIVSQLDLHSAEQDGRHSGAVTVMR